MQLESDGKRGRWITKILEYDLDINPTKMVKGKGLEKIQTKIYCRALGINTILNNSISNDEMSNQERDLQVHENFLLSPWYKDIVYFLQTFQCPLDMEK